MDSSPFRQNGTPQRAAFKSLPGRTITMNIPNPSPRQVTHSRLNLSTGGLPHPFKVTSMGDQP